MVKVPVHEPVIGDDCQSVVCHIVNIQTIDLYRETVEIEIYG